ncbi:MAG TPA: cytosol nonspecific dipeptidase, partial [Thermoanaerobaculia bacterium]
MTFVSDLAPQPLWKHFDALLQIPRPSKHEERACRYVIERAEALGLRWRQDATGNVVVEKPAS